MTTPAPGPAPAPVLARLRGLPRRTPLRVQLVAALTVLVALALLLTGLAASTALNNYLLGQVDSQLATTMRQPGLLDRLARGAGPTLTPGRLRQPGDALIGQVSGPRGTVLVPFPLDAPESAPRLPAMTPAYVLRHADRPFTVPAISGSNTWRVLIAPVSGGGSVALAADVDSVRRTVAHLALLQLLIGGVVLLALAGLGYAAVRSSLRPLLEVEATAGAIARGDLSRRVPAGDPRTEVGRLAGALNAMLGQVEAAFRAQQASETTARQSEERMRQFVADASHELRTPLTSIRGFAELYRQGAVRDPAELDRVMRRVEDEAARMGLLVEDLLLLARLDQQRPLQREPVDLLPLAQDAVLDARAVAPQRRVDLAVKGGGAPVVLGDEARLRQVFGNLVSNALTHTPATASVNLRVGVAGGWAVVEVADDGPGLPPEQAARVFERFYRADASRTRSLGGSGLGLSIVAALVAAHGGRVEVETAPGRGATFRVLLPLEGGYPELPELPATSQPAGTAPSAARGSVGAGAESSARWKGER